MSTPSVRPGSVSLCFGEVNTRSYYSPFTPIKDLCIGTYRTMMGVWTIANYKLFGGRLLDQKPTIQGYCEKAAFYCGYNPTYPHISELHLPGMPFSWEEVYDGIAVPVPKFPYITVHLTSDAELNKAVLKSHRNDKFGGGSLSYDAAFNLLQKIFPETQFSREDFLLTCGEEFTAKMHKQIVASLKKEYLDPILKRECENLIARWKEYSENDQAFNLGVEMRHLTSAVITGTLFGNSEHYRELSDAVDFMSIYLIKQVVGGYTKEETERFDSSCKVFAEIINKILQDENSIVLEGLTLQEKRASCLVFFFAGQETTAFALTHNFAELALNPELQEELRNKDLNDFINRQLVKLPPVEGVSRKIKSDTYIAFKNEEGVSVGKLMRKGERVTPDFTGTARNALQRLENPTYKDANVFGGGVNQCIGKTMALKEIREVMTQVLSSFALSTEESEFKYKIFATKQAEPFFVKAKII